MKEKLDKKCAKRTTTAHPKMANVKQRAKKTTSAPI